MNALCSRRPAKSAMRAASGRLQNSDWPIDSPLGETYVVIGNPPAPRSRIGSDVKQGSRGAASTRAVIWFGIPDQATYATTGPRGLDGRQPRAGRLGLAGQGSWGVRG